MTGKLRSRWKCHIPPAMSRAPDAMAVSEAAAPGPASARAVTGSTPNENADSVMAITVPRPTGCSRTVAAICASGIRLVRAIAAAHPIAAPVIP